MVNPVLVAYLDLEDCPEHVVRRDCLGCPVNLVCSDSRETPDFPACLELRENLVYLDFLERHCKVCLVSKATLETLVHLDVKGVLAKVDQVDFLDCLD